MIRCNSSSVAPAAFIFVILTVTPGFCQEAIQFEVGVQGGMPLRPTLDDAFCCTTGVAFTSIIPDNASYTAGISAGIVLADRFHITFGAMYTPVSFRNIGTSCCPITHPSTEIHGASWEFPALADYRWLSGRLRPFSGGGFVIHNTMTRGMSQAPAPVISGGVEWRYRSFVLRPEFRYTHYPDERGSSVLVQRPRHQEQILVGIVYRRQR